MPKMLRDRRDGSLYPMNEFLSRHESLEVIDTADTGKADDAVQAFSTADDKSGSTRTSVKRTKQSSE